MRDISRRPFRAAAVLTVRGCRPHHGKALQQTSGLGRHGSAPGGRRTLRSAQSTRDLASCALHREFIWAIGRVPRCLTGRMEGHPGLTDPYPIGLTNCLARIRSTGSRPVRAAAMSGFRGCSTPAVSPRSTGSRRGSIFLCWRVCPTAAVCPRSVGSR